MKKIKNKLQNDISYRLIMIIKKFKTNKMIVFNLF